jgi:hypothetical protein
MPALGPLISNFFRSRAPVVLVHAERASRPLVGNCSLRESSFSSLGLGPLEGHPYWVRDQAIKCAQSRPQPCAAGAPFQAPRPRA